MKEIPLGNTSKVALVDDGDYAQATQYRWYLGNRGYVLSTVRQNSRHLLLHRVLLNPPPDKQVDHKNHDRLDCRRSNLRIATIGQNGHNRPKQKNNTSGYKGVRAYKDSRKPRGAKIRFERREYYLGCFTTPEEAAQAYDEAAIRLHGEFAFVNFPMGGKS